MATRSGSSRVAAGHTPFGARTEVHLIKVHRVCVCNCWTAILEDPFLLSAVHSAVARKPCVTNYDAMDTQPIAEMISFVAQQPPSNSVGWGRGGMVRYFSTFRKSFCPRLLYAEQCSTLSPNDEQ